MAINLKKGQKIDLTKGNSDLKHLLIGLGWQCGNFDLDTAAFMLGANGKVPGDNEFIFYGNLKHTSGSVEHKGDNITGNSGDDAEQIVIDLNKVPQNIEKIDFTATIYDADAKKQNFGMVKNAYIRVVNADTNEEILRYDLGSEFSVETAVVVAEIYRHNGEWKFNAIGSGFSGGLAALCANFGITVSEDNNSESSNSKTPMNSKKKTSTDKANIEQKAITQKPTEQKKEKISLVKGQKISLTKNENNAPIIVENGWTARGKDYDLKALVRYRDGRLIYIGAANDDEVLSTPEGAVVHGGDVKKAGDMEKITIKWHKDIASVAVSSYSALENGTGSFREYGVFVRITNGKQIIEIPAASASAKYDSYTLCFGEIIFGSNNTMEVSALEMYSKSGSENRIGYKGDRVVMDIGPVGQTKGGGFLSALENIFS